MKGSYPDGKKESFNKHLNDWVPQASLKYQLTEAQSLKLNYTTSINRPGISYLNPALVIYPTVIQQGNPQLVSSHTQRISLVYSYILPKLTLQLAPGYHHTSGGISEIQTAKDDIRYCTYDNILRYRRASLENYVQWKPFDGTTIVVNNNLRYEHYENPNLGYRTFGWSDNYYVNLSQKLPRKLLLYLSSAANAPFNKYWSSEAETVNGNYHDFQQSWNRARSFTIAVTYRFGSLKASVKKTEHSIDNDDVVGGINKGS